MLKVTNLSKSYYRQTLFEEVSFSLNPKEKIGLIGRNGYGKSTLFRLILGQEEPDNGEIIIPKNYRIGALDQHIKFSKPTVLHEACLGLPLEAKNETWKAEKILFGLGFVAENMAQSPDLFSGGYQIRINLAKVLLSDSDLLLLDEPTNYLDIVSLRWLENFLRDWKKELIVISHDRTFMDRVITHTMAIHRQKIRKIRGSSEKMEHQIATEEAIHEKTRMHEEKKEAQTQRFIREFRAGARSAGLVQSRIKMLDKIEKKEKLASIKKITFQFQSLPFEADMMMRVRSLCFGYDQTKPLIQSLNLDVNPGDRIGIIGKNGKGKTTLLKLLAGKLKPNAGTRKEHPLLKIGYFSQTNEMPLHPERNILEEIAHTVKDATEQEIRSVCGSLLFTDDMVFKKNNVLSGGERSRVSLAKILMTPVHLLILDEPSNHLDLESVDALEQALQAFEGTIVFVTHNEMLLRKLAQRLVVFDHDEVFVFEDGYEAFLKKQGWSDEKDSDSKTDEEISKPQKEPKNDFQAKKELERRLRPIRRKIEETEAKILDLERNIRDTEKAYHDAERKGAVLLMGDLQVKLERLREKEEQAYRDLEVVYGELERGEW